MMLNRTSRACPSHAGRASLLVLVLAAVWLLGAGGQLWGLSYSSPESLRTYLICYRWLTAAQAESETTWWASEFDFFVSGSTDQYRDLLRAKTGAPIIRYLNINNVTRNEPTGQLAGHPDWDAMIAWLWDNNLPRERMFVHFAQDTVCRPINMPATSDITTENKFLQVLANGYDVTLAAWSGTLPAGLLAAPGDTLEVAFDERFDTVVLQVASTLVGSRLTSARKPRKPTRPSATGWSGAWEYLSATGWQRLSVVDGTGGLSRSGEVTFVPPADWAPDSSLLYRVRLVCQQATVQPSVLGVRGRDYIYLASDGYHFPGWEPLADGNGDGHLSPTELNAAGNASAHFEYEARVPNYWVGRYVLNVADPQVQEWMANLAWIAMYRITPPYDGIFVDNGWYDIPLDNLVSGGTKREIPDATFWQAGTMACLDVMKQAIGPCLLFLNTGNYVKPIYSEYVRHVDGWLGEFWIRSSREFLPQQLALVRERDAAGKISLLHARPDAINGDVGRGQVLALALYYICAGRNTYFFVGENYGAKNYQDYNWFGAMEVDLGSPLTETQLVAGTTFPIYVRAFSRGLVYARPLPRWDSTFTDGEYITLPEGSYRPVMADGTLGEPVSGTVFLRNAEGLILLAEGDHLP